jgi:hypothetical protein
MIHPRTLLHSVQFSLRDLGQIAILAKSQAVRYFSVVLIVGAITARSVPAETKSCDSVVSGAEIVFPYAPPTLLSISVLGSDKLQKCRFRIHLSPDLINELGGAGHKALLLLDHFYKMYHGQSSSGDYASLDFAQTTDELSKVAEHLFASALEMEDGIKAERLSEIGGANFGTLSNCFSEFYSAKEPNVIGKQLDGKLSPNNTNMMMMTMTLSDEEFVGLYVFR